MVILGDKKTPNILYYQLQKKYKQLKFLSIQQQKQKYNKISSVIGYNCVQRRNIGFIYAYENGYEIIATTDDDNIPYGFWGRTIYINTPILIDVYKNVINNIFDPLSPTNNNIL